MKADHRNILRVAFQSLNTGLVLVIPDLHQPLNSKGQDHIRTKDPFSLNPDGKGRRKKRKERKKEKEKRKRKRNRLVI